MIQHFRISLGLSTLSAGFQLPMYHFWAMRLKNNFRLSPARLRPPVRSWFLDVCPAEAS
jgi:hypothetical protein